MPPDPGRGRWTILAILFVGRVGLSFTFQTVGSDADPLVASLHLSLPKSAR